MSILIVGSLVACATDVPPIPRAPADMPPQAAPADTAPLPPAIQRAGSRWVPVRWAELPAWGQDGLHAVWNAWVRGCERPAPGQATLCAEVRQLSIASDAEQQAWVMRRLQPYRVTEPDGTPPAGLLTGYYEPIMDARRQTIPARRFGKPEEFGAICAFLCSVHAGYMTGQNVLADGGAYPGTY